MARISGSEQLEISKNTTCSTENHWYNNAKHTHKYIHANKKTTHRASSENFVCRPSGQCLSTRSNDTKQAHSSLIVCDVINTWKYRNNTSQSQSNTLITRFHSKHKILEVINSSSPPTQEHWYRLAQCLNSFHYPPLYTHHNLILSRPQAQKLL